MFQKLLIANRGEIAVRLVRACRDLGIPSVAVFSEVDRAALHVRLADEAYAIGPAPSSASYLRINKLVHVAREAGCDAVHPGYGFLAENAEFARACAGAGITFVGPSPAVMEQLGSKTQARELAHKIGVPMVPGVRTPIETLEEAANVAQRVGYPVLLKAVAGGGGKGMRKIAEPAALAAAWRDAGSEALNAFGDARLYLERYLINPRHIEVQIVGDAHGNVVYLGERECSVQRRHQKIIEESPSVFTTPELRRAMGAAAVRIARAAGYENAGTVEFLVDNARNFYFLEVNTRLQVEHPVTEAVTGMDLVQLQLRIAAGEPLPFAQQDVSSHGHAIECRIYAEDAENNFFPSPGKIAAWQVPHGPGVRIDEGVYAGYTVPGDYDPLLAKLICWGADRAQAVARMRRALREFTCTGIKNNALFLSALLADADFAQSHISTSWLDERLTAGLARGVVPSQVFAHDQPRDGHDPAAAEAAAIAAAAWHYNASASQAATPQPALSKWKTEGRHEQTSRNPREHW